MSYLPWQAQKQTTGVGDKHVSFYTKWFTWGGAGKLNKKRANQPWEKGGGGCWGKNGGVVAELVS